MYVCLIMFLENVSRSFWSTYIQDLCTGCRKKEIFHWWFSHLVRGTEVWFSRSYQIHFIFCRNKHQTRLPPHFRPCAPSQFFLPSPYLPFLLPPHTRLFAVYAQPSSGSYPRRWILVDPRGTVSIGTCREPGSLCFLTHVFVVWPQTM